MGEAETLAIIETRNLNAVFLTDDRHAAKKAQTMDVNTCDTMKIIAFAEVAGRITGQEAQDYLRHLATLDRKLGTDQKHYLDYVAELRQRLR